MIQTRAQRSVERRRRQQGNVVKPAANFAIVDFKDYNMTEETIHNFQVNAVSEKTKTMNAEAEES